MPTMQLVADEGCPFAHRILALGVHLGLDLATVEVPIGSKHPVAAAHSPTGRVPLLVHGALVLGESVVIGDYLAEVFGWPGFPDPPGERARHREAMALFDSFVVPGVFQPLPVHPRAEETLELLDVLVAGLPEEPSRLAFHLAPFYLRLVLWYPEGPLRAAVARLTRLDAWLGAVCRLDAVAQPAPSATEAATHLRAAKQLLSLP